MVVLILFYLSKTLSLDYEHEFQIELAFKNLLTPAEINLILTWTPHEPSGQLRHSFSAVSDELRPQFVAEPNLRPHLALRCEAQELEQVPDWHVSERNSRPKLQGHTQETAANERKRFWKNSVLQ